MSNLYESDEYKWKIETANKYKNEDNNLFHYLLEMSKRDERELKSYLKVLFLHLLKWKYHPNRQSVSWYNNIINSSQEIQEIFNDSITLQIKYKNDKYYLDAYKKAKKLAINETGLNENIFPKEFPWDCNIIWTEEFIDKFIEENRK